MQINYMNIILDYMNINYIIFTSSTFTKFVVNSNNTYSNIF